MTTDIQSRIEGLLAQMTLDEKVAQLGSVPIRELVENRRFSPQKAETLLANGIGHITRLAGWLDLDPEDAAEIGNAIQKFLRKKTRLGIPAIIHEECLSGFMAKGATTFPQAIGMASTWDPALIQRMTTIIRQQMRAVGTHHGLSPVLDVVRDPRWGRTEETFGEDHLLVACMGIAYVKGLQGDDLRTGVIATVKHFAAHALSEGGRNQAPVHLGARELREVFLYPFEMAVKVGKVESLMNAYHDLDGVPCAASRELLTDILRGEWGFEGAVVSDYGAVDMLHTVHHTAADKKQAAKQALEAGIDIELPSISCYGQPLLQAVKEGLVSEETVNTAVRRVLRHKFLLGLFENALVDPRQVRSVFDTLEQRALAREVACKSIVLLKNDGILPLSKDIASLAIIGPNAASTRNLLGDYTYTGHLNLPYDAVPIVSIREGIKNKASAGMRVHYAPGCDYLGSSRDRFAQAVEAARRAEVAVIVVGGRSGLGPLDTSGEHRDRTELDLPGLQGELVKAVCSTGTPVVVVLVDGRPVADEWMAENVSALVEAWLPGEEGGNAVADILFGDVNPGGKLPLTVPRRVGQVPLNYNRSQAGHKDYVFVKGTPLFPFGHGLSYTAFEYSDLKIAPATMGPRGKVHISVKVKNIGQREGDEVVQLYTHDQVASVVRPLKELKGFERITLNPGEEKTVSFELAASQLAFYNGDMRLAVEPGTFEVLVGSSSEDIRLRGYVEVV